MTIVSHPDASENVVAASTSIHERSTLAAVSTTPFFTTPGNVHPTGPFQLK